MVIFDRKAMKPELAEGEVPGTTYDLSLNGWMDSELFETWFVQHFLTYAPPSRPLLLLMDGHMSHFSPTFVNRAAEEEVVVFCLPPHSIVISAYPLIVISNLDTTSTQRGTMRQAAKQDNSCETGMNLFEFIKLLQYRLNF